MATIYFTRKDKSYPISGLYWYTTIAKTEAQILKLYNWILNGHNNINVLLTNTRQAFFRSIKLFCDSNGLDYKLPLNLYAYIEKGKTILDKDILYLEIEQGDYDDCINFDNDIYEKIK